MKRSILLSVLITVSSFFILTPLPSLAQITINEIRIDQTSTDNDEYFELAGTPGGVLNGFTYLVIGDGTGGSGVIEAVVDLTSQAIPTSGFFVAAEDTFLLGTADLTANLNFENSDNVTHLLVRGFTGSDGDDLDTDDDGTLDVIPWSEVVDCVALVETVGSGDQIYCATTVGPDGTFVPGHVFLCPEGWQIGQFDPVGGNDTPGAGNPCGLVAFDIKPGSCPNPINVKSKGVLPAAIMGTDSFDVTTIDPDSLSLEGVAPLRWAYADVGEPFEPFTGKEDCYEDCVDCSCADGNLDLVFHFDTQEVVAALGSVDDQDCLVLEIMGALKTEYGGTSIVGEDVVRILKKGK